MKAVCVGPEKELDDFAPGEWAWLADKKGIIFCLPNGHKGAIHDPRWAITGDGDTITAKPSIWYRANKGTAYGEWHGFLTAGEWKEC